jgi:hypothetical protein
LDDAYYSLFPNASLSLRHVIAKSSGKTRVSAAVVMKFVSPEA